MFSCISLESILKNIKKTNLKLECNDTKIDTEETESESDTTDTDTELIGEPVVLKRIDTRKTIEDIMPNFECNPDKIEKQLTCLINKSKSKR